MFRRSREAPSVPVAANLADRPHGSSLRAALRSPLPRRLLARSSSSPPRSRGAGALALLACSVLLRLVPAARPELQRHDPADINGTALPGETGPVAFHNFGASSSAAGGDLGARDSAFLDVLDRLSKEELNEASVPEDSRAQEDQEQLLADQEAVQKEKLKLAEAEKRVAEEQKAEAEQELHQAEKDKQSALQAKRAEAETKAQLEAEQDAGEGETGHESKEAPKEEEEEERAEQEKEEDKEEKGGKKEKKRKGEKEPEDGEKDKEEKGEDEDEEKGKRGRKGKKGKKEEEKDEGGGEEDAKEKPDEPHGDEAKEDKKKEEPEGFFAKLIAFLKAPFR